MIHYHGTPMSGTRQDAVRALQGRHALIPFARQDDLGAALEVAQSFMLDNSAFTYWKAGKGQIDFDAYLNWCVSLARHPGYDFALIPDVIDGTEAENCDLVMKWLRIAPRALAAPVWHLHESLEWLEWLVDRFWIVALGSSGQWATPGTASWWTRMAEAMAVACDSQGRPKCKLHGLRMLDPRIFSRMPLSSADSTNAGMNAGSVTAFGMYPAPTAGQRAQVIAARIEAHNSAPIWCPEVINQQETLL